ncbi:MAG: tripartite tricarboxylate transporter substrate binding protein [Betaproteobacteria bacterium]|nr:tripartite tricarboxylate transporter substrate binding protein [Betaproteobacteria bacterium]
MPLIRLATLATFCAITAPLPAAAQNFPTKPVRIVVGFPAGGPADIIARTTGQKLAEIIGQQVVIDNRGGASGMIAAEHAAKSAPDGYTTHLIGVGAYSVNPALFRKISYSRNDFAWVTLAVKVPEALVVHPSLPVKNVKELIALAKARPGELNYCSAGAGGVPHLAAELFRTAAGGIKITHVPYKGAAPAVADMIGGHTQMGFWDTPILVPHVNSGRLRALMIATAQRFQGFPNVPTSAEAGLPTVIVDNYYGVVVPAATNKDIVARLQGAFAKALQSPEVRDKFNPQGIVAVGSTTEEMIAFAKVETEKWVRVAKSTGVTLD